MRDYLTKRRKIILFASLVMLLTTVPYLMGYANEGKDWFFSGFVIGVEDGNSYIAKMLSGANGKWLFRSPYSIEEQRGVIAYLPYLLLGKLTAGPAQHEQLVALFQAFRIVAGMMAILASYDFISLFVKDDKRRFLALVLTILGGGLGWLLVITNQKGFLGSLPLDFISPESFGFLGLLGLPHLAAARALLLWGFTFYLNGNRGWLTGLFWLGLGFFQPMFVLIAWAVAGLHGAACWLLSHFNLGLEKSTEVELSKQLISGIQAVIVSSPIVIYTIWAFLTDPYLKEWSKQNILPSPSVFHYLIAYGLVAPLAIMGIIKLLKTRLRYGLLLTVWLMIFPIMIYAPVTPQRRLAEGIWVVLIAGFFSLFNQRERLPFYIVPIAAMLIPTTLFLLSGSTAQALNPSEMVFLPAGKVQAYQALTQLASDDAKVLADFKTGNSLPAWAFVRVVIGHGPETAHYNYWRDLLDNTLSGSNQADPCNDLFEAKDIDFLFWGPDEQERWDFSPSEQDCLAIQYNSDGYSIYQVVE